MCLIFQVIMRTNTILLSIASLPGLCTALSSLQSPPAFWNGGIPSASAAANTNSPANSRAEVKVAGKEHPPSFWNGGIPPPAAIHSSGGQQVDTNERITNPRYPDLPLDRYLANPYFHRKQNQCWISGAIVDGNCMRERRSAHHPSEDVRADQCE